MLKNLKNILYLRLITFLQEYKYLKFRVWEVLIPSLFKNKIS